MIELAASAPNMPVARCHTFIMALPLLATVVVYSTALAETPARCDIGLTVQLTPDVPNPTDQGFLNSLLSNQVDYLLTLRRQRSDTLLDLELTGPGPSYRCRQAIEAIRRDGHVLTVYVDKKAS